MLENIEEALEAIWVAEEEGDCSFESIRKNCKYTLDEIILSSMINDGLVEKNEGTYRFTHRGRKLAEQIIRRHRLTEVMLYFVLGITDAKKREAVACEAEHTLQDEMVDGICTLLGHPSHTMENQSIPRGKCCIAGRREATSVIVSLRELEVGESGRISYIKPESHGTLRKLFSLGIIPGVVVKVIQKTPAVTISFDKTKVALDRDVAGYISVTRLS